jgi:hypothetical protein
MSNCATPYPAGLGACKAFLSKVDGIAITPKGTTFTDATFILNTTWKTAVSSSTPASRTTELLEFIATENTSEAVSITTTNLGKKVVESKPTPSLTGYLNGSLCDYQTILAYEGQKVDIVLFLQDGKQMGTRTGYSTIKGFRATIAVNPSIPVDESSKSFPVYIFFEDQKEFESIALVKPTYNFRSLLDYVPVGVNLVALSTLSASTGVITLGVYKRGTNTGLTGLILADITVLESNATAPVATTIVVEVGQGVYTVTINESIGATPGALEAGEWALLQVAKIVTADVTYLSNTLLVTAE